MHYLCFISFICPHVLLTFFFLGEGSVLKDISKTLIAIVAKKGEFIFIFILLHVNQIINWGVMVRGTPCGPQILNKWRSSMASRG